MIPNDIKIYHIVHVSNLSAIIAERFLVSYAEIKKRPPIGETIGMLKIKERRLSLPLTSHPGLNVGDCVPFYFCPRSPMLFMFYKGDSSEIEYQGGQEPIVHLVADLRKAVDWANKHNIRWAFTKTNAGSRYFVENYADLSDLDKIDWDAIQATYWKDCIDRKQAEFLVERCFPWELFDEIGVYSYHQQQMVHEILGKKMSFPIVKVRREWYY
jgi:hypothetical protein